MHSALLVDLLKSKIKLQMEYEASIIDHEFGMGTKPEKLTLLEAMVFRYDLYFFLFKRIKKPN